MLYAIIFACSFKHQEIKNIHTKSDNAILELQQIDDCFKKEINAFKTKCNAKIMRINNYIVCTDPEKTELGTLDTFYPSDPLVRKELNFQQLCHDEELNIRLSYWKA